MKKIILLIIALIAAFQLNAQHTIQVGSGGSPLALPYTNQYEYNWCSVIYPQNKIKIGGDITKISYWLSAYEVIQETAYNQKVYMAHTSDVEFTDAGYPNTASMTLVYDGVIYYKDYRIWDDMEIVLTTPFAYNNSDNLIVHLENHDGSKNSFPNQFLYNRSTTAVNYPCKYNQHDGSFPETTGSRTHQSPNVFLTFDSGLDVGISKINNDKGFILPGLQDVKVNFANYMADVVTAVDIEWEINGVPQTTYNWTGSLNPGQESEEIILAADYDLAPDTLMIKAWTTNPNAGVDELNTNDTLTQTIVVADYVEIGDLSYVYTTFPYPTQERYGWSSSIYNSDSLQNGKICGIAYYKANEGYLMSNQKILLTQTAETTFSSTDLPDEASMSVVYSGDIDYSGSIGWDKIEFDSIFMYENNHLQVHYRNYSGQYHSPYAYFRGSVYGIPVTIVNGSSSFPTTAGAISNDSPDIRVYYVIPTDAGIESVDGPKKYCSTANNDISVTIKNYGTDNLTSANIKYQIDNGTIQTFDWTGDLPSYHTEEDIIIGDESFTYGEHTIKIWTDSPNGLNDYKNDNDTLYKTFYATNPLCGNYVVGEAPSDFLTLKEAVDSLNSAGVSCDVVFDIKPGTYNAQYRIDEIKDAGINSMVTFKSQTADSTDVVLTTDSTDYLFYLNGVDYLRLKHLTITSDSASALAKIANSACNNTIEGNRFIGKPLTDYAIYSPQEANSIDTSNTIVNNYFEGAAWAIHLSSDGSAYETNNHIISNQFKEQTIESIYLQNQKDYLVSANFIKNINAKATYIRESQKGTFEKNKMYVDTIGSEFVRFLGNEDTTLISNNFIKGLNTTSFGVVSLSGNNFIFANNTVVASGRVLHIYGNDNLIYNNIIISEEYGHAIWFQPFTSNNISDYNCLYSREGNPIGEWNNTQCFSLAEWQNASGLDLNSVSALPVFYSETDLHTNSLVLDGAGTPLPEVTDDIDGDPRDAVNPDIGADEFTSTCPGPLSGIYTIGASGDYATFNEATTTLLDCGVGGSVTFNVEAGTYYEQVDISEFITGYTESDSITFQSATGDSTSVILTYSADTLNNYTLKLNGADRVVFNRITIQAEDATYGRAVEISNGACNNLITNCVISGAISEEDNNWQALVYFPEDPASRDTSNIIQGNKLINGSYGIFLSGNSSNKATFNILSGNYFSNQSAYGIYANYQKNLLIEKNIVENSYQLDIDYCGINVYWNMDSTMISKNRIDVNRDYNSYGLRIGGYNNLILNNFISLGSNIYHSTGIYGLGHDSKCYNNSINIYGSGSPVAINVSHSTKNADIKNNVFANHASGYALHCGFSNSQVLSSDFNDLYSNGEYIANWFGVDISNLSEWQIASGFGNNSVSSFPDFVSNTDLHTSNVLLNNAATPLPEVTDDIDGEPRDAVTPDIGADEFESVTFSLGDDVTVCVDDEYKIDAGEGFDSYLWSTGADSSYILVDSTGIGYGSNEYSVTVTLGGETFTDAITVTFSSPIAAPQDYFCFDMFTDSVLVTAGDALYYLWSTGEITQSIWTSSTVSVTVTDANGCQDNATISRHWNSCPANLSMPEDTTIYIGETLVLDANANCNADYDNYSYLWSTGETTETIAVIAAELGVGSYHYSVTVTNNSDSRTCTTSDMVDVNVSDDTAVEDFSMEGIFIYPNPTDGILKLEFSNTFEKVRIRIINAVGQVVFSEYQETLLGTKTLDLAGLEKGIYILSIKGENIVLTNKIILY